MQSTSQVFAPFSIRGNGQAYKTVNQNV